MELENLKYPIGRFKKPPEINDIVLAEWIAEIEKFPDVLKAETASMQNREVTYRYRPGGWNILQVIHHCADSHLNSFIRFKLALTEEKPVIKPYFEERWAEQTDALEAPIEYSLEILSGLHKRWAILLKSLNKEMWEKTFIHPEHGREFVLKENLGIYAWHGRHHLSHIRQARELKYSS